VLIGRSWEMVGTSIFPRSEREIAGIVLDGCNSPCFSFLGVPILEKEGIIFGVFLYLSGSSSIFA